MEILRYEVEKIFKSKILWALVGVFLAYNLLIIYDLGYMRKDVNLLNKVIDEVGLEINEESKGKLKEIVLEYEGKSLALINQNRKEKYDSIKEALSKGNIFNLSKEEEEYINEGLIIGNYYYSIDELTEKYNRINIMESYKKKIEYEKLTGIDKELYLKQGESFEKRLEELKNKDNKSFFFQGRNFKMHKNLFNDLLGRIVLQNIILTVILGAFIYNYEFENKTSYLIYSTKKGRDERAKLKAVLISSVVFLSILLFVSLFVFFTVFDYSNVFRTSIDSIFNWETLLPHLGWFKLNVMQYLILSIIIIYILNIMMCIFTRIVSYKCKNTYIVFIAIIVAGGVLLILPSVFQFSPIVSYLTTFTPITLINGMGSIFSISNTILPTKNFEFITIILWTSILFAGYKFSNKRFKKEDI